MIFFLTGCLLTDAGEIRITCEDAGSCDSSSDVDPPNYAGGYTTKRCEEAPIATGYAVGDVVPDLQFTDHHNEALQLSDFCGNTVALVGCVMWSTCFEEKLEGWFSRYRDEASLSSPDVKNESGDTPPDLQDWASANGSPPWSLIQIAKYLSDFQAAAEDARRHLHSQPSC